MIAQRNFNKLIQSKQISESILGNTFPNRISIRALSIEKLGEMLEIGNTFEFTEGGGKAMFNKLLNLNNLCACPVRNVFTNGVLCGEVFPST